MHELSLIALVTASVIGSPHCAGMCGGFVTYYSGKSNRPALSHAAYSLGRLLSYLTLGILAGALGKSLNNAGLIIGVQRLAMFVTGALLVVWGIRGLTGREVSWGAPQLAKFSSAILKRILAVKDDDLKANISWPVRSFFIGLFTTLLPCGWLYSFVAFAAASANPFRGAYVMFFFWLGTLPIMLALGSAVRFASGSLAKYLPRLTAALILCAGLLALSGKAGAVFSAEPPTCHGDQDSNHQGADPEAK